MTPGIPHAAPAVLPTKAEEVASSDCTMMTGLRAAAVYSSEQTSVQRTSGRAIPHTAVGPSGRQPTASALASCISGMQPVLFGVRDITPHVPNFIFMSSIIPWMLKWPALVPSVDVIVSEGEEAPAGWEQYVVLKGSLLPFCQLVSS